MRLYQLQQASIISENKIRQLTDTFELKAEEKSVIPLLSVGNASLKGELALKRTYKYIQLWEWKYLPKMF